MNLWRYWPLAVLLLGLAGCSGTSPASPTGGKTAAELIESGNAALARGDLDGALADFTSAADAQPDSAKAHERRAAALLQTKQFEQAVNDCNAALKLDRRFASAYFTRGLAEKDLGNLDKALEDITMALDNGLERVDVLAARGALYYSLAKRSVNPVEAQKILEKALQDFDRAVKLDPRQVGLRRQRAAIYLDLGDYENAVADCDAALQADANLAAAHVLRARGQCELGEIDRAVNDCDAAIRLDENLIEAYVTRARARLEKASEMRTLAEVAQCERALVDCQAAIGRSKKFKGDPAGMKQASSVRGLAHELRGSIYHDLHAVKKALAEYDQALSLDPGLVSALLRRAVTRSAAEDFPAALSDCNLAVSIDSARPEAYFGRGMVYSLKQEFPKAVADFNQAVSLNPNCAKAYGGRALVYSAMAGTEFKKAAKSTDPAEIASCREKAADYRQKCIDDASQAIRANRHLARAYLTRAMANANQKLPEKALADFAAAIREDPKIVKAYYNRGLLLANQGRLNEAIADFEDAGKLQPDNPRLDLLTAQIYRQKGDTILANKYLESAREKTKRLKDHLKNYVEDPADLAETLQKVPELQPDVDVDPLEKAKRDLEKKLDATAEK